MWSRVAIVGVVAMGTGLAVAQPGPTGHDLVTVGAAGNRATLPHEMPWDPAASYGAVPYEFRMTRQVARELGRGRCHPPVREAAPPPSDALNIVASFASGCCGTTTIGSEAARTCVIISHYCEST